MFPNWIDKGCYLHVHEGHRYDWKWVYRKTNLNWSTHAVADRINGAP